MNIREAILKAADSVEQNPRLFDFSSIAAPDKGCGTPGCALGWIGVHLGLKGDRYDGGFRGGLDAVLRIPQAKFYGRMNDLDNHMFTSWKQSARICAETLRLYADRYHPAEQKVEKPKGIPVWCREIFEGESA